MARMGANMTVCTEMELYIILTILENFEHWNQAHLIAKMPLSQAKSVQYSKTIVGFSSEKKKILQHIMHLDCTSAQGTRWKEYGK